MKLLLLRGQVPTDRDPKEIVFDKIDECDDMWTQLAWAMVNRAEGDKLEVWYWGGRREHKFASNFTERWTPSFKGPLPKYEPDVIFCRGGFPEYHHVLAQFPKAYKIYYGAGRRYLPQKGFYDYDLILQDSPGQLEKCKKLFPKIKSSLFIKPAADNLFRHQVGIEKKYDICFPANGKQWRFKGHKFVFETCPKDLSVYNIGNASKLPVPSNVTQKRFLRPQVAAEMQKCRVGIVCSGADIDSCPRVIPEMLACNLPVVVLNTTRFWVDKYICSVTGEVATKDNFWKVVREVLDSPNSYFPSEYYTRELSLCKAADFILESMREES